MNRKSFVFLIITILILVVLLFSGCGQKGMQENVQQTTPPPIPTRVPTPGVPVGEGFAYKDKFLGFITIIEGEGWEV